VDTAITFLLGTMGFILAVRLVLLLPYHRGAAIPIALMRLTSFACVYVQHGVLHSHELFLHKTMALADMQKVEYAYHAVIGFVAVWIFTSKTGEEIVVGSCRTGIPRLLRILESELPPFSVSNWKQAFKEGDVEDTLLLWGTEPNNTMQLTNFDDV